VRRLGLVLGCLLVAVPGHAASVRDMLGREVTMPAPPRRIVSLVPSVTETLFAVGGEDRLVGVTTFCDFPPAARQKPKVGGIVNPSLEAIVGLRPDLVLATTEGNRESTVEQLTALGIPTYVVTPKTFSGVLDSILRIGSLSGRLEAAERLVDDLRRRAARVVEATGRRPRARVLYVVWADPLVVPGRATLINDLIGMAGGASVSADEPVEWPRLSLEQVVASAPEVVIFASHSATHVEQALKRWQGQGLTLPAFRTGRVRRVDTDLVHRPGPRIVEGLEALARAIHPGALP